MQHISATDPASQGGAGQCVASCSFDFIVRGTRSHGRAPQSFAYAEGKAYKSAAPPPYHAAMAFHQEEPQHCGKRVATVLVEQVLTPSEHGETITSK